MENVAIKDAATIILVRDPGDTPQVLMGQRGAKAAFMPKKFVFPGGAVDASDAAITPARQICEPCNSRLNHNSNIPATPLINAAIRELWEESGQILGYKGSWGQNIPHDWKSYADTGHIPAGNMLHFVFRAITPPSQPRRFDARFFLADAKHLHSDPDDFSAASDELSHLQWVTIEHARSFDLPFITEVVLAEIAATLPDIAPPKSVPFFNNSREQSLFERLGGQSPLASAK